MPVEITTVSLKPADFFTKNPALGMCDFGIWWLGRTTLLTNTDVPQSNQRDNKSVLVLNPLPTEHKKVNDIGKEECCNGEKPKL